MTTSETKPQFVLNKAGFRIRPRSPGPTSFSLVDLKSRLLPDGTSKADPKPLVVPVRLPSIDQRVALYERAGAIRAAFYDEIDPDDFLDYLDDLPEEGLSPHELAEHDILRNAEAARTARSKAKERVSKRSATPPAGEAAEGSPATAAASPAPAGGGK